MLKYARYLALPAIAVLALAGAEYWYDGDATAVAATELRTPEFGPRDFAASVRADEAQLSVAQSRVAQRPQDWLAQAVLARALSDRAGLHGDFDALVAAQRHIVLAEAAAPERSGPGLIAAHVYMGAHLLDEAEGALDNYDQRVIGGSEAERAEAVAIRGDIAFYRGDMAIAQERYAEARRLAAIPGVIYREALLAKAQGRFDDAEQLFHRSLGAMTSPGPRQVANVAIQLGGIDQARGRYEAARDHFVEADQLFPGFWLFEAHVAQGDYLTGRTDAALQRLETMLEVDQPVEIAELYALFLQAEGREAEARPWAAGATAIWDERLDALPEAAYGHAIEHHFKFGSETRALDLAQRNLALRPYGEAQLLMAEAYLANDRPADALSVLRRAKRQGWRSAPHLRAEINALEALGRDDEARPLREEAEAINPHVFGPLSELVWLSHG
ncbi:MAG: hypothetical protein WBA68_11570 [Alteraurantiacibacter sp.]